MDQLDKKKLLADLADTWCKLAPSPIEGVGVFAIRDIPAATHPFCVSKEAWTNMSEAEIQTLHPAIIDLIRTYCVFTDGFYSVPKYGFKMWDMVDFLNDAKDANVISIDDGEDFITTRPIKKGEELLIDYDTITEVVPDEES